MSIVTKRYKRVAFFAELNILISRNRNVLDVRASLKVGLQMEQGNSDESEEVRPNSFPEEESVKLSLLSVNVSSEVNSAES